VPLELAAFLAALLLIHVIVGLFARRRGQNPVMYFLLSLVLSPLIALVVLAISSRSKPVPFDPQPPGVFLADGGEAAAAQWATPPRSRGLPLALAIGAVVTVAALVIVVRQGVPAIPGVIAVTASPVPLVDGLPPPGQIWFGQSYDPQTFEIKDRISGGKVHELFVVVGQLPAVIDMSTARLRISLDGRTEVDDPMGLTGEGDVYALNYTPPIRGVYRFELTAGDGDVLASGAIQVD
jgi:hypothetical protein